MTPMLSAGPGSGLGESHGGAGAGRPVHVGLIDSDAGFVRVLANRLDRLGWESRLLASAVPPQDLVAMRVSVLVIDLAVLGSHGWGYLERVCSELPALPVIVCAGPSTVAQRVRGLRLGADDWLSKPCHPEELIARAESVMRRRRRSEAPRDRPSIDAGGLSIVPGQFQAFVNDRSVELTRREFELIHVLADAHGQVLQREEIYQRVWGYAMAHGDRSVDVFVRKLRQKLESASPHWRYIHTHFGVGYRFAPEPGGEPADPARQDEAPAQESTAASASLATRTRTWGG